MEKRAHERVKTRYMVKVCGKLGVISDISSRGMQISTSLSPKSRKVDIILENSGHLIKLLGVIQWIRRRQRIQAPNQIGVIIKKAPPEYRDFVNEITHH